MKYHRNGVPVVESEKQTTQKKAQRVLNATLEAIASGQYIAPDDRKTTVADLWGTSHRGLPSEWAGTGPG